MSFTDGRESLTEYELKKLYYKYPSKTDFYDIVLPGTDPVHPQGRGKVEITGSKLEKRVKSILEGNIE